MADIRTPGAPGMPDGGPGKTPDGGPGGAPDGGLGKTPEGTRPAGTGPVEAETDGVDRAPRGVPSAEELKRIAVEVRIRRRPRIGVFIVLGMLAAGLAALVWAMSVPQESHTNWGSTVWVTTLGAMAFGALIGAGLAVLADWLSRRK